MINIIPARGSRKLGALGRALAVRAGSPLNDVVVVLGTPSGIDVLTIKGASLD